MSSKPLKKERKDAALNRKKEPLVTIVLDQQVSISLGRLEEGMDLEFGGLKPGGFITSSWVQFGRQKFQEALEDARSGDLSKMSALMGMALQGPKKYPQFYAMAAPGDRPRKISMPKPILEEIKKVAAEVTACCDFRLDTRDVLSVVWKAHALEHQLQLPRVRMPDAPIAGKAGEMEPAGPPAQDRAADAKVADESHEGEGE